MLLSFAFEWLLLRFCLVEKVMKFHAASFLSVHFSKGIRLMLW